MDLHRLPAWQLAGILEEETGEWAARLHWNFRPSADLVERYVGMRSLDGVALLDRGEVVGYSYYVQEERKGLIGDLYLIRAVRSAEGERHLLDAVLAMLARNPVTRRVEAQLMMLDATVEPPPAGGSEAWSYSRQFMLASLADAGRLPERGARGLLYENWSPRWMEASSGLIADVYRDHVDSRINDQYRSPAGARRFLHNIVHFPGCGQFRQEASYLALEAATGSLAGICLATRVAPDTGHITQVCVARRWQGFGVGYEMMRRSLVSLLYDGCREVSLTVTASNAGAVSLYERMGFSTLRTFRAFVWDGM